MAFMDKLGQMAGKIGEVAGDTFDYGKAKGKIVLERGKAKDAREALGEYVYNALKNDETLDITKMEELCDQIDIHIAEINRLEEEAKQSGADLSGMFKNENGADE